MKDLETKIKEHFDKNTNVPEPKSEQLAVLKKELEKNKPQKRQAIVAWRTILVSICCVLIMLPCILVPIYYPKPEEKYYGENDVEQTPITQEYAEEYISQNYSGYSFVFEDCNVLDLSGFYEKGTTNLLAIKLTLEQIDTPIVASFNLIINKNYKYGQHDVFVGTKAVKTVEKEYTLYKTTEATLSETKIYVLKECRKHNLYLTLNIDDVNFIEKFL